MTWNTQDINSAIKQGITRREEHAQIRPCSPILTVNFEFPYCSLNKGEADSSYSLLCAHSFTEARAADVTHTYAHTHQSRSQISSVRI